MYIEIYNKAELKLLELFYVVIVHCASRGQPVTFFFLSAMAKSYFETYLFNDSSQLIHCCLKRRMTMQCIPTQPFVSLQHFPIAKQENIV